jgi:hypothetical protein
MSNTPFSSARDSDLIPQFVDALFLSPRFQTDLDEHGYFDEVLPNNWYMYHFHDWEEVLIDHIDSRGYKAQVIDVSEENAFHPEYILRIATDEGMPGRERYYVLAGDPETYAIHVEIFRANSVFQARKEARKRLDKINTEYGKDTNIFFVDDSIDMTNRVFTHPSLSELRYHDFILYTLRDNLVIDYRE